MTKAPKASASLGRVVTGVCFVASIVSVSFSLHHLWTEWKIGCFFVFPHRITEELAEEARYPWKICQKDGGECVTAEYDSERGRPNMVNGCFTYQKGDTQIAWCGMEMTAESLPKRVISAAQGERWTGWFENNCVDLSYIDEAMENAFKNFELECAHLVVTTGRMWDCRGNAMSGIEELSGTPLGTYEFPSDQ